MLTTAFALLLSAAPRQEPPPLDLEPLAADELMAMAREAPAENGARERKLIELFLAAGAAKEDVRSVPLDAELLRPRRDAAVAEVRARMEAQHAAPDAITAELAALDARWADLGGNVFAILPGKSKRVLAFAAHYDTVKGSPGVVDNWASCTLLVALFRALRESGHDHTVWFLGFAGQEEGCLGSASWVGKLRDKQGAKIDAVVTLDCAGAAAPKAWWSGSSAGILELVSDAARRAQVPLEIVDFAGAGSDNVEIKKALLPVASLLGLAPAQAELLHGPRDTIAQVDPKHLSQMHVLTLAVVAELDRHPEPLRWDYVQAKLRIGDPASGRKPLEPVPVAWPGRVPPGPPSATPARDASEGRSP
jgi:hypothetical protein